MCVGRRRSSVGVDTSTQMQAMWAAIFARRRAVLTQGMATEALDVSDGDLIHMMKIRYT